MSETKAPVAEIKDVPIVVRGPLRMSYDEYLNWEHEGGLTEWVDGEVIIHMPPKDEHQSVVEFLHLLLGYFVRLQKLGKVRIAPFTMRAIPDGSAREPDLLFLATDNLYLLTSKELNGPADLAIEVISDDSVTRDKDDKFYEYQAAGVKEYWIIDPRPRRLRAEFYVLDEQGRYQPVPLSSDNVYHSTVVTDFRFKVDWLWRQNVNPLVALAQIVGAERIIEVLRAGDNEGMGD